MEDHKQVKKYELEIPERFKTSKATHSNNLYTDLHKYLPEGERPNDLHIVILMKNAELHTALGMFQFPDSLKTAKLVKLFFTMLAVPVHQAEIKANYSENVRWNTDEWSVAIGCEIESMTASVQSLTEKRVIMIVAATCQKTAII